MKPQIYTDKHRVSFRADKRNAGILSGIASSRQLGTRNDISRRNLCFAGFLLITSHLLLITAFSGCASLDIVKERIVSPEVVGNRVTFYYDSISARSVSVAGEFNGWEYRPEQSRALIMKKNEKGIWQVTTEIPPGRYQYKIVVDYQTWLTDPYNTNTIDDGTGNINSLLIVR